MAISIHYGDRDNGVMRIGSKLQCARYSPLHPRSAAPPSPPNAIDDDLHQDGSGSLNRTIGNQEFLIEWDGRDFMAVYIFIFCLLALFHE